jgi:hypothetical protein
VAGEKATVRIVEEEMMVLIRVETETEMIEVETRVREIKKREDRKLILV